MVNVQQKYGEEAIPRDLIDTLKRKQAMTPHFPKKDIAYLDIFSLLSDPICAPLVYQGIGMLFDPEEYDVIVAIASRGYPLGTSLSCAAGKPLVPATKLGKSPRDVVQVEHSVEYKDIDGVEIQRDYLHKGMKVLVVDDLIATGSTAHAVLEILAADLLCVPVGLAVFNRLEYKPEYIPGQRSVSEICPIRTVLHYTEDPKLPEYNPNQQHRHTTIHRPYAMDLND